MGRCAPSSAACRTASSRCPSAIAPPQNAAVCAALRPEPALGAAAPPPAPESARGSACCVPSGR
eukprot:scaffold20361_cov102-Isochrysis_galbana.AAC.6